MPVYWFALSQVVEKDWTKAILIFIVLHVLLYPASNGYNSYMDRDQGSIGGLKTPLQPTRQLLYATVGLDCAAVILSCFVSFVFLGGIIAFIIASKAYSYRGIRLKKYPVTGYLTVVLFQGALIFFLVFQGCHLNNYSCFPLAALTGSTLLIGGFYPLTQIYQHQQDSNDGVKTLSIVLGYRGTFLFAAAMYMLAFCTLTFYFMESLEIKEFFVFATCMLPVLVYFLLWARKVWKDEKQANFSNTMRMNFIGAFCSNLAFILILITNQ